MSYSRFAKRPLALAVIAALGTPVLAQQSPDAEAEAIEEITVVGKSVSYANNATSDDMLKQQTAMTSALAVIDNLPGVLINEGDTFGSDDWSTTVSIRGFQLSLDEQQIGITVDGMANGNSNYGGGAKANRYIDTENLQTVEVSQGTADIASRSNEALGGTLNFTTVDPTDEANMLLSLSAGDFDAQKFFVRYNTGEIFADTYAWISASGSANSDWIQGAAENERDHFAAKVKSLVGEVELTAYVSYDDVHEDNYQRISKAQFKENPSWDRLTEEWTGVPFIDQAYRRGWSTLRENLFAYLQADYATDELEFSGSVYYHDNSGRGDWVPQYIVNITDDGAGNPHSELVSGNTVYGGKASAITENAIFILPHDDPNDPYNKSNNAWGQIGYVDRDGRSIAPASIAGCSSLTFPYGGSKNDDPNTPNKNEGSSLHLDPACFPDNAIPVGSYRHTHYGKQRLGINGDFSWLMENSDFSNELRGGFWYEDYQRDEHRDWHKIIDSRASFKFDHTPYWVQYDNTFDVSTLMLYLEDEFDMDVVKVRLGVKKFMVELEKTNNFTHKTGKAIDSDSDLLWSAGVVAPMPVDGLEAFAGFAQNFAAIKDAVLERADSALSNIEPETADNFDMGLRYTSNSFDASLTYYNIKFENRLVFIPPDSPDGIDYTIGENGSYINVGGIDSSGFEAAATWYVNDNWGLYASFTNNSSEYVGEISNYPKGNTVIASPENMLVISADWVKDNYFAGLSGKWVSERYMDAANKVEADAYTVADFYAGVSLDTPFSGLESMELRFTINNLTDESYLGGITASGAWIGAPRTAAFNLSATF